MGDVCAALPSILITRGHAPHTMKIHITCLACASLLLLAQPAFAQSVSPSPEQMIEQLRAPLRTRSLRNLTVQAATQGSAGAEAPPARPSLSLSIQFDFDSARIRPESQGPLANLAHALASPELLPSRFVIEGHTDAKGSADYNRKLSDQRALAVRELLVAKGVDAGRLLSVGKGSSEPVLPDAPLAAENRRVKIVNMD